MGFKRFTNRIRSFNPYDIPHSRTSLYKPNEKKYRLEIGEGSNFLTQAKERLGRNFNLSKLSIVKIVLIVFLSILFGRAWWLQVVHGNEYRQLADNNRLRLKKIAGKRGIIYDRNKIPLVRNAANFILYFIPADLPKDQAERDKIIDELANIFNGINPDEVKSNLAKIKPKSYESFQPLPVADNIDYDKAMLIYLKSAELPGVFLDVSNRRQYNLVAQSLAHILGYTGKINAEELAQGGDDYSMIDYIGKDGLESYWEKKLKGIPGKRQQEVDALGKEKSIISQTTVTDGANLLLSIDAEAQAKLEGYLRDEMAKAGQTRAVGIVTNPNNGEIICLVSIPSFDNNVFARGITKDEYQALAEAPDQPLFNRAVSGEYPSGSTIKPVGVAAALQTGVIDENKQILSNGGIRINQWFFPDWKAGGHGLTNARKAIAESVNTYMYYIGGGFENFVGLGVERLTEYYKLFGLGKKTGIDLPGEADGFVPSKEWKLKTKKEKWYIGDTYHIAIGQGDLLTTPLQVSSFTSYFAAGGKFYQPHLVKAFLTDNDKKIEEVSVPAYGQDIISQQNINIVREGMRQAVQEGSARRFLSLPVTAAAKTGTAQFASNKKPHAWLTGFAPYDNPEISITILIEEGEEGSVTAVGAAYNFLNWYFGARLKSTTSSNPINPSAPSSTVSSSQPI